MNEITHVSAEQFKSEVMESSVPVLVDFYADWCGPCRMLGPVLQQVADQTAGRARIVKVNVDEEPELASAFGVSSIPALFVVKSGKVVGQSLGLASKQQLLQMLDRAAA